MKDHYITLNGLKFHYVEWPSERKPTLLLVHGFAGHAMTWDVFAPTMTAHYRVLALDSRGHGDSEWSDDYSTEAAVADLHALTLALGLTDIVLIGHSMGGRNAMLFLNRYPDVVAKFIIIDTGPQLDPGGGRRIMGGWQDNSDIFKTREEAFIALRGVNQRPPIEHHRSRIYHSLKQLPNGQWTWKYDVKLRRPAARPANQHHHRSLDDWWQLWANIACPTLLVRGAVSDLLTAELAQQMVAANPRCTWVDIAGAGHSVPMDRPMEFEATVKKWLGV